METKFRVSFEEKILTEEYYSHQDAAGITVAVRVPGFCSVGVAADGAEGAERLGWEALAKNERESSARDKWTLISVEPLQPGDVMVQEPSQAGQHDWKQ